MTGSASGADAFGALADPSRRRLLVMLQEGERTVTELAAPFPVSRSAISQQLAILRAAELVSVRKVGRRRLYRVQGEGLRPVIDWISYFDAFWDSRLAALARRMEVSGEGP